MACFYSPLLDRAEWGQGGRHGGSNRAPGQQISVNAPQLCPRTSLNQSLMFAVKEREFNIYVYVQIYLIFFGHGDNQNNSKHTFTHASSSYEWFYGMFSFVCVRVWPCQKLYSIEWKVYWCLFFLLIIWIWLYSLFMWMSLCGRESITWHTTLTGRSSRLRVLRSYQGSSIPSRLAMSLVLSSVPFPLRSCR